MMAPVRRRWWHPRQRGEVWWAITTEMASRWRKVRAGPGVTAPSVDTAIERFTEGD
jgi:hypothetical protein